MPAMILVPLLAALFARTIAAEPADWASALETMPRRADGSARNQWSPWPLLSALPRPNPMGTYHVKTRPHPQASFSVEGDDDADIGLDSQDESRRAKLRGKACYFKICPFNTRAL